MTYREYPDNPHTFIVHHTEGTGEQGGSPIVEKEEVFSCNSYQEAMEWGLKRYPRITGWEWDNFKINVNILTERGQIELKQFHADFEKVQEKIKANPDDYITVTGSNGMTITFQYNEAFDGPKKEGT